MKTEWMRCLCVIPLTFVLNGIVVAQEEASTQETPSTRETAVANNSADREALIGHWQNKNEELNRKLLEPIEMDFVETPMVEVLAYLMDRCRIEVIMDKVALEAQGVDASTPITRKLSEVPLRTALDVILHEHQLTYYTKDGILFITSQEEADNKLVIRVYNVHSLLTRDRPLESLDQIMGLITNSVVPDTWSEFGGPGTIHAYQMAMVVSQTERGHELIESLLDELDQVVAAAGGPTLPPPAKPVITLPPTQGSGLGGGQEGSP